MAWAYSNHLSLISWSFLLQRREFTPYSSEEKNCYIVFFLKFFSKWLWILTCNNLNLSHVWGSVPHPMAVNNPRWFIYSTKSGAKQLVFSPWRLLPRCPLSKSVWTIWWQVSTTSLLFLVTETVVPKVLVLQVQCLGLQHLGPHRPTTS